VNFEVTKLKSFEPYKVIVPIPVKISFSEKYRLIELRTQGGYTQKIYFSKIV
jgi:hypothetical protein